MNITDSIIIGISLMSLTVVIVIIAKSLKRVDKDIIQSIESENELNKRKNILTRLNKARFIVLEWLARKIKQSVQKIHFWTIKAKKQSGNEFMKAKEELNLNSQKSSAINKQNKNKIQNNKTLKEGDVLEKMSLSEDDTIMDSVIKNNKNNKNSFIKTIFKRKKSKKRNVDIKKRMNPSSSEWSLVDNSNDDKQVVDNDVEIESKKDDNFIQPNDAMIGVDRKILEKKILQKIDKNPKDIDNYRELGELYIKMKKYDDAREVFGYVLQVLPDDIEAKRRQDKIKLLQEVK